MHFCLEVGFRWCSRWNMSHRYSCITKLYIMFLSGRNLQSTTDACQSESHLKSVFCFREGVERNQNENVKGNAVCSKPGTPFATVFAVAPHLDPFSNFPWSFKLARVIHLSSKMEVQWLEVLGSWGWLKSHFTTGSMSLIKGYINISVKSLSTAYWPTSSIMPEHCEHCREKSTPFVQPCPLEIRIYYKKMMRGGVSI